MCSTYCRDMVLTTDASVNRKCRTGYYSM